MYDAVRWVSSLHMYDAVRWVSSLHMYDAVRWVSSLHMYDAVRWVVLLTGFRGPDVQYSFQFRKMHTKILTYNN